MIVESVEVNKEVKLSEFVNDTGNWEWEEFASLLPFQCILKIAAIKPPQGEGGKDPIYWSLTPSGSFTVKSIYQMLQQEEWDDECRHWNLIWRWG
ncbi:hypothetical protein DITRI_Ditri12bG0061200 [Diplodiscus trichospermus]